MSSGIPFSVSWKEMEEFRLGSGDRNPLHGNDLYARNTVFGRPVVFGILAFLRALSIATPEEIRLRLAEGVFRKPIFPGRKYRVSTERFGDSGLVLDIFSGEILQASFTLELEAPRKEQEIRPGGHSVPLEPHALRFCRPEGGRMEYELGAGAENLDLWRELSGKISWDQLRFFAWTSYFVGMLYPGEQALYSGFQFRFGSGRFPGPLEIRDFTFAYDENLSLHTIQAVTNQEDRLELHAFERPGSRELTFSEVLEKRGGRGRMKGKRALVTGGSRGFGAAIAMILAAEGAELFITYHSNKSKAEKICRDIVEAGGSATAVRGAWSDSASGRSFREAAGSLPLLDMVVANASGPIEFRDPSEFEEGEWDSYLEENLEMLRSPLEALIPRLQPEADIVFVSSPYVAEPPPGFAHYGAAKREGEALIRKMAALHPQMRFSILRPGKMLTDQTNTIVKSDELLDPLAAASNLLDQLLESPPGGVREFGV